MLKYKLLTVALLAMPMTAWAMPGNVTGIEARAVDNGVRVSWDPAEGSVAKYRVFWSHESILENGALFDDVVETDGPDTSLVLDALPAISNVYVTVLAVDPNGEESELFEEEAHATRTAVAVSSQQSSEDAAPDGTAQRALKVDVLSATGVVLHFSMPVLLDAQSARTAFSIMDGANQELQIYRVKTDGRTVALDTLPQIRQRAYRIRITAGVRGLHEDSGDVVPLAGDQTDLLFLGSADGVVTALPTGNTGSMGDVQNVSVAAQPDGRNSYTVVVSWQAPATQIAGYRVAQTRDGGQTYGGAQMLAANVSSIRMAQAASGELGILIQAVAPDGAASRGVLQRILLPATGGATTGSVMTGSSVGQNSHLPQTGAGSAALLALAGACAGVQTVRRRKTAA